jgi:hypothetical protein
MNMIRLMLSWSALSHLLCHVERSETSLDMTAHTPAANDLRFFPRDCGIRMTATRGFRRAN